METEVIAVMCFGFLNNQLTVQALNLRWEMAC